MCNERTGKTCDENHFKDHLNNRTLNNFVNHRGETIGGGGGGARGELLQVWKKI